MYVRKDRFNGLEAIRRSGRLVTAGASGRQSSGSVIGRLIEQIVGAKLFERSWDIRVPGNTAAVRQGEVDAAGNTFDSFLDQLGAMLKAGELVVMVQLVRWRGKGTLVYRTCRPVCSRRESS